MIDFSEPRAGWLSDALTVGGPERVCPCCHQKVKLRKRRFSRIMARSVLAAARAHLRGAEWVPGREIAAAVGGSGDYAKPRFWSLMEPIDARSREANAAGLWRLTRWGWEFLRDGGRVQSHCYTYNNCCYGFSGEFLTISDALGQPFDYQEVCSG